MLNNELIQQRINDFTDKKEDIYKQIESYCKKHNIILIENEVFTSNPKLHSVKLIEEIKDKYKILIIVKEDRKYVIQLDSFNYLTIYYINEPKHINSIIKIQQLKELITPDFTQTYNIEYDIPKTQQFQNLNIVLNTPLTIIASVKQVLTYLPNDTIIQRNKTCISHDIELTHFKLYTNKKKFICNIFNTSFYLLFDLNSDATCNYFYELVKLNYDIYGGIKPIKKRAMKIKESNWVGVERRTIPKNKILIN